MWDALLVTDGSSDAVLVPVIRWLLAELSSASIEVQWADLRRFPHPARTLDEKLATAVASYDCDLLFVHRDAEGQDPARRYVEVSQANRTGRPHVAVVPVRMQEAWLLVDEVALRQAAGRPSGCEPLHLPSPRQWEGLADPKHVLHQALIAASGAKGRRAKAFNAGAAVHRMADLVTDWSRLRELVAFQRLEADTRSALTELGAPLREASIDGTPQPPRAW